MNAFAEGDATSTRVRTFWLLALNNVFVGGMVGLERTVVPLLGRDAFGLTLGVAVGAFIVSFSVSKAVVNLFAGVAADRFGRKRVLVVGWLVGLPVPLLLIWAPTWEWVLAANVLLGVNQALAWSMTVNMMIDLAPPNRRGFAAGINEFAGYLGVSLIAFLTGLVASTLSLRPEPFYIGIGVAVLGLMLSLFALETAPGGTPTPQGWVSGVGVPSVLGCATNLKDGLVWLSLPILLSARGMSLVEIGTVAGLYPLVWALGQPFFGPLSDRIGRKPLLAVGMGLQGFGLVVLSVSGTFPLTILAALILGLGTAMVYPTLIAAVADRVPEAQRATALGIYRFFRDGGYAVGAVIAGFGLSTPGSTVLVAGIGILVVTVLIMRQL